MSVHWSTGLESVVRLLLDKDEEIILVASLIGHTTRINVGLLRSDRI